ncbi:MAG: HAD hydrolase family protein [Blastocatellia bacterium]|nr:HAD hydrolase family protein [Blastocatellia bacterium]
MPVPLFEITARAAKIRLLLSDCDGVMTDGGIYYSADGKRVFEVTKVFNIHDGQGFRLAQEAGLKIGIISGRASPALAARARELQIDYLYQGVAHKIAVYEQIKATEGLQDEEIAYLGDDLPDLGPMRRAGLSIAVADAVPEIRDCAHFLTNKNGGRGAVREAIEMILKAKGRWEELILRYDDKENTK